MNLILLILRLLIGPLAPSWNEGVPLAVRRDGRLENRLHRPAEPQPDRQPAEAPWSLVWKLLTQGVLRAVGWVGRWLWPARPGGST
jgi:hypothetical protein